LLLDGSFDHHNPEPPHALACTRISPTNGSKRFTMQDELERLNGEIKAKLALIEELRQRMQTAWNEVHSRLERGEDKQAWAALDRYYAAKDTLFTAHQDLAVLVGKQQRL
jgi:hypothetical protein